MISKILDSTADAVRDIPDGATLMIGGFGTARQPLELIDALLEQGAGDLTIVNNNAGNGTTGLAALLANGRVRKIICSFPRQVDSQIFDELYRAGKLELELAPQEHPGGTDPGRRRRNRRVLHAGRVRHQTGGWQEDSSDQRARLRARGCADRRLCTDQGA